MKRMYVFVFILCAVMLSTAHADLNLPEGTTEIGAQAFMNTALTGVLTIPEGVTSIGEKAFYECDGITELVLPSSVNRIESKAFAGCSALAGTVVLAENCIVAEDAFDGCELVTVVHAGEPTPVEFFTYAIQDNVVIITGFDTDSGLTKVVVPNEIEGLPVVVIGEQAFANYEQLQSITIPEGVTAIWPSAFEKCYSLKIVQLPESLELIYYFAFSECTSLTSIHLPDGLAAIGSSAFSWCTSLTEVNYPLKWEHIIHNGSQPTMTSPFHGCLGIKRIVIPEGVTYIPRCALQCVTGLREVVLPSTLEAIEAYGIFYCPYLEKVAIPESVGYIGDQVFKQCDDNFTIYGIADSYAESYAQVKGFNFCAIDPIAMMFPAADYYRVINAYSYNGEIYGEAVLTKEHNGVAANSFFFIDISGKAVTDAETICALWTMWMYKEMESAVLDNVRELNNIAKIWSSTAMGFMKREIAWQTGGEVAGNILKGFTTHDWIGAFKGAVVDNFLNGNEASAWMQMATVSDILSYMDNLVEYINQFPATDASSVYLYENVDGLIRMYFSYLYAYEVAENLCKPIIDEIIEKYEDDADVAWHFLYEALSNTAKSYSDAVELFFDFSSLCINQNDDAAWSTITDLLNCIEEMDKTVIGQLMNITKTLDLIDKSLKTITEIEDGFIVEENDWMEVYFKTPGEIVDTELYQIQLLMAQ